MLPSQFRRLTDDSQPLVVDPQVALKIGLNESIVIRQLHYWLGKNEHRDNNNIDGKIYCYNSLDEWQKQFPFWSKDTVKRTMKKLKDLGLIEITKSPTNSYDKTNWYTINYEAYSALFDRPVDEGKLHPSDTTGSRAKNKPRTQSRANSAKSANGQMQNKPIYKRTETTRDYHKGQKPDWTKDITLSRRNIETQEEFDDRVTSYKEQGYRVKIKDEEFKQIQFS